LRAIRRAVQSAFLNCVCFHRRCRRKKRATGKRTRGRRRPASSGLATTSNREPSTKASNGLIKADVEARTTGDTRLSRTGVEMTAAARLFGRDKLADRVPKPLRGNSRRRRAECLRSPVSRHLSRSPLSCLLQDGRQSLGNHSDKLAWPTPLSLAGRYIQHNRTQCTPRAIPSSSLKSVRNRTVKLRAVYRIPPPAKSRTAPSSGSLGSTSHWMGDAWDTLVRVAGPAVVRAAHGTSRK
jgi:hypothetical protein